MRYNTRFSGYSLPANSNKFAVISGSLSHIQRFIYDTSSQGALKNLRGRSFYLSLLARAIADSILNRLNLSQESVLYNSGGTFCIIAPSAHGKIDEVNSLIKSIKTSVANLMHSDMVNISVIEVNRYELECDCQTVFDRLFSKRHRDKFSPHGNNENYESLFTANLPYKSASYEDIGSKLSDITAIFASHQKMQFKNALEVKFEQLGVYYYLGRTEEFAKGDNGEGYLLLINDEQAPANCDITVYREYIAGNGTRANSFENLFVSEASSHERLAVLRMDVDNLGALLRLSMNNRDALSEYAKFSQQLDAYFKQEINKMWQEKYSGTTVIIYAGGDDLFIVGEWENALAFMREINMKFKHFFSDKSMSLSGGVSFVRQKYPIIRAAEMSAEEETIAKSFEFNGTQKNAISLFQTPLRWEFEYKWIMEYQDALLTLINYDYIDKSFIQHIMRIGENVRYVNGKIEPIRYIWLAAYDLSRMAKRKGGEGEKFIKRCIADMMSGRTLDGKPIVSPYHSLQLITIAARLVEMKLWKINK